GWEAGSGGPPATTPRPVPATACGCGGREGLGGPRPHQLSGGIQMRAALARALVTGPDLLLFDEPFSAVDELLRERLQEELMRLFTAEQFAALFITHSVAEAGFLSTRVMAMTPRPGTIGFVTDLPFSYPRARGLGFTPQYISIVHAIADAMRDFAVEQDDGRA